MAKRKRLTVPDPRIEPGIEPAPEVKSAGPLSGAPIGIAPVGRRAPIADVAGEAATRQALTEVAEELTAARKDGRLVMRIPLSQVSATHMARDRVILDEGEMETLKASLRARGQQTPIEVVERGYRNYGLISGLRRLTALRDLETERGEPGDVLAFVRTPETAADAYTAMVEENEIRVGLSYFERANVIVRSVSEKVFRTEKEALSTLFASASASKRSKIKSFIPVVTEIGGFLHFPNAVGERQGLALAARIAAEPEFARRLRDRLRKRTPESAEEEQATLTRALAGTGEEKSPPAAKGAARAAQAAEAPGITVKRGRGAITVSGAGLTGAHMAEIEALVVRWRS